MGYKTRGFAFSCRWYADDDATGSWLNGDLVAALLDPLEPGGYLAIADQISVNLEDHEPIGTLDQLRTRVRGWAYDVVAMIAGDPDDPSWLFHMGLDTVGPRIFVGIAAERARPALREDVAGWVAAWSARLEPAQVRFAVGRFEPAQDDYARPIPPRTSPIWQLGSLDQYAGIAWHQAITDRAAVLERLQQAALPPGAHRSVDGDVLRISFDADLTNGASLAAARVAHERWLTPLVSTEPEAGWNEHGDRLVVVTSPEERSPLTLYDASTQVGYKALVVQPWTGEVDEPRWAEAQTLVARGSLPDGTPLTKVRLIFPRREDALLLHDRALASGFEMVTYPDEGGFWQVNPTRV